MTYQQQIGRKGENIAADYLTNKGYRLLEQNYHTRYGELDLVMSHGGMIVFVEVKTRTSRTFGAPETSITPTKLEHLINAGLLWLQEHPEAPDDWRIDVVSIFLSRQTNSPEIQHFRQKSKPNSKCRSPPLRSL